MDTTTVRESTPEVCAPEDRPHACLGGFVFVGRMVAEGAEEVEVIEAVPCRRCSGEL